MTSTFTNCEFRPGGPSRPWTSLPPCCRHAKPSGSERNTSKSVVPPATLRDLDVLIVQLAESREIPKATRQKYQSALRKLRKKAQGPIVERFKRTKKKNVAERTGKLVAASRWRESKHEPLLREFAGGVFAPLMEDFLKLGAGDLSDFAKLHELRILGKRLRYAMELLSGGFHKQFRSDLYPMVEQLQDKLGLINDYASASARCQRWLQQIPADPDQWKHLAEVQQQAADQAADDFRKWWTGGRLGELRDRWEQIQAKSKD